MKRIFIYSLLIMLVFLAGQGNSAELPPKKKVVVIDAGHGGRDSGAKGKNSEEKDIVLSIALKVGSYLEQNISDVQVIYTRKTDVFIPLYERAKIANKNNADLFVSIHANSNPNTRPYGTETFAMGLHKTQGNLEVAKKENAVIVLEEDYNVKYEGFDPNSAESYIIFSLMQNTYLEKSLLAASYVQDEFRERAKRKDRGVKQAGFLVLWNTSMPSILVETGFISNEVEEKYLLSNAGQEYLASAIYRAIKRYLNELEEEDLSTNATKPITSASDTKNDSTPQEKPENKSTSDEQTLNHEVVFRVQVTSASSKIENKEELFEEYEEIFEYNENNLFKYTLGKYTDYKEVKKFQKKMEKSFPGAFIVAFKNNERIPLTEALKESN